MSWRRRPRARRRREHRRDDPRDAPRSGSARARGADAALDRRARRTSCAPRLVPIAPDGEIAPAKVASIEHGGTAYIYVVLDPAAQAEVMAALETIKPAIGKILTREELAAAGGAPRATLALAAAPGHGFSDHLAGPRSRIVDRRVVRAAGPLGW
jgi:hypothetical protein